SSIVEHLDRFEKLCFGLSMVHELSPRLLDAISATGELLAAPILAGAITAGGVRSVAVPSTKLIVTNDQFGAAEPLDEETRKLTRDELMSLLDDGAIPVVTGFIGATSE